MKDGKCPICKVGALLVLIGALNWGSVGIFQVNFVEKILGGYPTVVKVIYILVGLSGLLMAVACFKACPACKK